MGDTDGSVIDTDGGPIGGGDGGPIGGGDGGTGDGCGTTQCSNCIDDDNDGLTDGFDPHCTSSADNDETSFATGISGDNIDEVNQDCFFDGNSGGGDDGCNLHVCCLLGATTKEECPADLKPQQFDPTMCTPSATCIETCDAVTPPGCDCFGCCTVCNDAGECYDVLTNPAVSPECDVDVLDDPTKCYSCTKVAECGTECDNTNCELCPGQTEDDLPAECNGTNQCPDGLVTCEANSDCGESEYCSNGCCVDQIIVN